MNPEKPGSYTNDTGVRVTSGCISMALNRDVSDRDLNRGSRRDPNGSGLDEWAKPTEG